jgi:hypothetical protein
MRFRERTEDQRQLDWLLTELGHRLGLGTSKIAAALGRSKDTILNDLAANAKSQADTLHPGAELHGHDAGQEPPRGVGGA